MQYTPQNDVIKHPSKNEPPGTSAFVKTFLGPQWPSQRFGFFFQKKSSIFTTFLRRAVGFGNLGGPDAHMETSTSKVALLHVAEISGEEDFFPPPGENSQVRRRVLLGKHFFFVWGEGFVGFSVGFWIESSETSRMVMMGCGCGCGCGCGDGGEEKIRKPLITKRSSKNVPRWKSWMALKVLHPFFLVEVGVREAYRNQCLTSKIILVCIA